MKKKMMRRGLALCLMAILACAQMLAVAQVNKLTRVSEYDAYDEVSYGMDKNCNPVTIGLKQVGNDVVYSILDANLKPGYSFTIRNVNSSFKSIPWECIKLSGFIYDIGLPGSGIFAVQGLLDDENKWIVAVAADEVPNGNGFSTYIVNMISEDGEIYYGHKETDDIFLRWLGGAWFLQNEDGAIYTMRTKDRPSEVNEMAEAGATHVKGVYTLDGVKVAKAEKGLYIVDGKKVMK